MILLFRFYNIEEKEINENIFKLNSKRHSRYIESSYNKFKSLKIYEHYLNEELEIKLKGQIIESYGKYIEINNKKYYRSNKDYLDKIIHDLCEELKITDSFCQIVFTINNNLLSIKYNNYNDLYIVFKSFEEFYLWFKKNKASLSIKIFKKKKINIKNSEYINRILKIIENHFNSKDGNILLFRMVFHPKKEIKKI